MKVEAQLEILKAKDLKRKTKEAEKKVKQRETDYGRQQREAKKDKRQEEKIQKFLTGVLNGEDPDFPGSRRTTPKKSSTQEMNTSFSKNHFCEISNPMYFASSKAKPHPRRRRLPRSSRIR